MQHNCERQCKPLFALLCDGGTDVCTENHSMVYLGFLDTSSYTFIAIFLCCVSVKGDDTDHHYGVLMGILESSGIDKKTYLCMH